MNKSNARHQVELAQTMSNKAETPQSRQDLIERLFNEHNEVLLRFLRLRLQSDAEAHEVAQEAYVRLLKLDEPGALSYLRAYLFKIAANLAVDRVRERQRSAKYLKLMFFEQTRPSEEDRALVDEKIRLITGYINELPPKCRKAFLLSCFHGLSTTEISKLMLLSTRMVRKYLVRATEYCRTRLDEDMGVKND